MGAEEKHTYLPLELCTIVKAQRCIKKLSDMQTSSMIKATARSAPDREAEINSLINKVQYEKDVYLKNFGISVSKKMTEFNGRILPPPKLQYGGRNRTQALPNQGVWDMRGKQFYFGVSIDYWAIISFASSRVIKLESMNVFIAHLVKLSYDAGMNISPTPLACTYITQNISIETYIRYFSHFSSHIS